MDRRYASEGLRGQTLPVWTLAVLTALTLMFFALNYANVIRWQIRAQNAADAAAAAALTVQANQWNKTTAILYAADVEEWRIRHIMQALIYMGVGNGGCNPNNGGWAQYYTDSCAPMYATLQPQLDKAIARYGNDIALLQAVATNGYAQQKSDAANVVHNLPYTCYLTPHVDCSFTYHLVDYSPRATSQQVGKDAYYLQAGGFTSPQDSTPTSDFEPARIEVTTCATVKPLIPIGLFGGAPKPFTVIGHAAATNVPQTSEWFVPGVNVNPPTGAAFQVPEDYDPQSVFGTYMTLYFTYFEGMNYTSQYPTSATYTPSSSMSDDFSVKLAWWASIPLLPYATPAQSQATLCTQT
jgi:hypothetical protein